MKAVPHYWIQHVFVSVEQEQDCHVGVQKIAIRELLNNLEFKYMWHLIKIITKERIPMALESVDGQIAFKMYVIYYGDWANGRINLPYDEKIVYKNKWARLAYKKEREQTSG